MPKLYNQYCYATTADVRDSIESQMIIPGRGIVQSTSNNGGVITVNYLDDSNLLQSFDFTPPVCSQVGFDNSFTGISTVDAVEIGGLVSLALILAFSVKIVKRGL